MNLPPNSSFGCRSASCSPVPHNRGYFIVQVDERKTKTSKCYSRRYLVHDLGMVPEQLGRHFRMRKSRTADNKEQEVYYNVLLSTFGPTKNSCDCKGLVSHGHCVHVESLSALLAEFGEAPTQAPRGLNGGYVRGGLVGLQWNGKRRESE